MEIRSKNRKIKISRGSGGVRSSALDMFYTKDSTFDFLRKNMFSDFFSSKKNPTEKKSRQILEILKLSKLPKFLQKKSEIFFGGLFFDKKIENVFLLKKSKVLSLMKNISKAKLLTPPESREILIWRKTLKKTRFWR